MINIAIVSVLTSAALAQAASSSAPSATSTSSSLIPTGISSSCSSYLTQLNSDSSLQACTGSIISATSNYGPGGSGSSSSSAISSTLSTLCSSSTNSSCPDSLIRSTLANFYQGCSAELTSSVNEDVLTLYDVLYTMIPMKEVLCTKDDSGSYCATKTSSYASSSVASAAATDDTSNAAIDIHSVALNYVTTSVLSRRGEQSTAVMPNTTTWEDSNLAFLFLSPDLSAASLCTTCTRNIVGAFVNFESSIPYAPGLGQSTILQGQSSLYSSISDKCGPSFLSGTVAAAGSLSGGSGSSNDSPRSTALDVKGTIAVVLGVATVVFMSIQ